MRQNYFIICLFLTSFSLNSQSDYKLIYSFTDGCPSNKLPDSVFKSKLLADKYIISLQNQFIEKGYLLFSTECKIETDKSKNIEIYFGPKFKSAQIQVDSIEQKFLKRNNIYFSQVSLTSDRLSKYFKQISEAYLYQGYPFVKLQLTSIKLVDSTEFRGNLNIIKGEQFKWGKIIVKGDSSISQSLIQNISGIRFKKIYNEKMIEQLDNELSLIPFIDQYKKPELLFSNKEVDVYVFVKSNPVSSINGAVGLQPNPSTQRMAFTGQIQLKLQNALKKAELIEMNWRSIQPGTQNLYLNGNVPYLFKSKFGIDGKFNLYKRDTSFIEIKSSIGVTYQLKNNFYFKGFYSFWLSNLLNNGNQTSLSSTSNSSYGISIIRKKLDYLPNPRKGTSLFVEMSAGNRKITTISDQRFTAKGTLVFDKYFPLAKRHVLKMGFFSEWIYNEQTFSNERLRFGGLNSLRGFNEEELYATFYANGQVEYRFLLDRNSTLFAFYNQSWYEDNSVAIYRNDKPLGFGAGLSFGTKLGIFSITYALGKQLQNQIQLNQGKIHIGYISYF
jgi:outer membrane protein assembly factor BamA